MQRLNTDLPFYPHKSYLFSLNELYFLKCAISTHNFLKPEWIHSRKTTIRRKRSIFPNILSPQTAIFWASCIRNQMSVFDRRPLRTNICKYANFIPLFSSHWTIRTMVWTWQKLLCRGGVNCKQIVTLQAWNVTLCLQSAGKNHQTKTCACSTTVTFFPLVLKLLTMQLIKYDFPDPPWPVIDMLCPRSAVSRILQCSAVRMSIQK